MWLLSQAAVRGRGHERTGLPCQDKVLTQVSGDFVFGGLADGAGSARLSHFGAEASLAFSLEYFKQHFDAMVASQDGAAVKARFMEGLTQALDETCLKHDCQRSDLASTLLVVAIKTETVILMHLGDGVIGYRQQGQVRVATGPTNGEFANQTVFTTSSTAIEAMQLLKASLANMDGFVLMSDGTEASCYDKRRRAFAKAVDNLLLEQSRRPSAAFTKLLEEAVEVSLKPATTDDCSLVLMVKSADATQSYEALAEVERRALLGLAEHGREIRFARYEQVMRLLNDAADEGLSVLTLARALGIKEKHLDKHLQPLIAKGLLVKRGRSVFRAIR